MILTKNNFYRSHYCKDIQSSLNKEVCLAGWVESQRDHGKISFWHLRDHTDSVQIVLKGKVLEAAKKINIESVIQVKGKVVLRKESDKNESPFEILTESILLLSEASNIPFNLTDEVNEDLRYQNRFFDLRRKTVAEKVFLRGEVIRKIRELMWERSFTEIQTPILTAGSPEGARDYLVPSRIHKGKFYALPQAPQQFKQFLMIGGVNKYFQIAPCFRDEDSRADRYMGEFYQLDLEMSFVEKNQVISLVTNIVKEIFQIFQSNDVFFSEMTYEEALIRYGSDKPDLRNPLFAERITDHSREIVIESDEGVQSKMQELNCDFQIIRSNEKAKIVFSCNQNINLLTQRVIQKLGKINEKQICFCWVKDFPMYEKKDKITFSHNPFSQLHDSKQINMSSLAHQYDLVCNGIEIGSGAIRNICLETMYKVFEFVGYTREQVKEEFKAMTSALQVGVPPHGGFALGIERIIMIISKEKNIRELFAFPLNQRGEDKMMGAPKKI